MLERADEATSNATGPLKHTFQLLDQKITAVVTKPGVPGIVATVYDKIKLLVRHLFFKLTYLTSSRAKSPYPSPAKPQRPSATSCKITTSSHYSSSVIIRLSLNSL